MAFAYADRMVGDGRRTALGLAVHGNSLHFVQERVCLFDHSIFGVGVHDNIEGFSVGVQTRHVYVRVAAAAAATADIAQFSQYFATAVNNMLLIVIIIIAVKLLSSM